MDRNWLGMLGLANKAGRLAVGEEPVGASARAREAQVIFLASDAAGNTKRRTAHFAEAGKCPWVVLPCSKAELGDALGRSSCAMVAVTDVGFASSLMEKLAAQDPERYGESALVLDEKRKKQAKRRQEEKARDKNRKQGGRKPRPPKAKEKTQ